MEVLHNAQAVPQLLILATKPGLTLPFLPLLCPVTTAVRDKGLSFPDAPVYLLHSDIVAAGYHGVNHIPRSCWHTREQRAPSDWWSGVQNHSSLLKPRHWTLIFLLCINQLSSVFFFRKDRFAGSKSWLPPAVFWGAVSCRRGINGECSKGQILCNA